MGEGSNNTDAGRIRNQGLKAQTGCRSPAHLSDRHAGGWCRPHPSLQSLTLAGPCESHRHRQPSVWLHLTVRRGVSHEPGSAAESG